MLSDKEIFDAIRERRGSALSQDQVNAINAILYPDKLRISEDGKAFIKSFEGFGKSLPDGRVQSYPDPGTGGAPWTIGWGSTGPDIRQGTIWTVAQCEARFSEHVMQFEDTVRRALTSDVSQHQFDAMVSLCYNIGPSAFAGSSVLRKHNAGDRAGAQAAFSMWVKAGGKVMNGLVRRRKAEADMYAKG